MVSDHGINPLKINGLIGLDHGVGHPLLLPCNAKAPNHRKNKAFKFFGHYAEWPKVAGAVIEGSNPIAFIRSQTGVSVAGVQKTTIRTFAVNGEEENEGILLANPQC
jgi:hypothetical protein